MISFLYILSLQRLQLTHQWFCMCLNQYDAKGPVTFYLCSSPRSSEFPVTYSVVPFLIASTCCDPFFYQIRTTFFSVPFSSKSWVHSAHPANLLPTGLLKLKFMYCSALESINFIGRGQSWNGIHLSIFRNTCMYNIENMDHRFDWFKGF